MVRQATFKNLKNTVKIFVWCKQSYKVNTIHIKNSMGIFTETNKQTKSKIHIKLPKILNSQKTIEKKEPSWRSYISWFQNISQSYRKQNIMILAQWQKYRPMELNRSSQINTCIYSQLIFGENAKNIQQGKISLINKCVGSDSL